MKSNKFLTEQIITYIGNKRGLLNEIEETIEEIKLELGREDIVSVDLFSGSGVVARLLKEHSKKVIANDLEKYSYIINSCYLSNKSEFDIDIYMKYYNSLQERLNQKLKGGIIYANYAPKDDINIKEGERVFYTSKNAKLLDTIRDFIDTVEVGYKKYFLAPLLYEASVHTNTGGVFKGFYKDSKTGIGKFGGNGENALERIMGKIELKVPILSDKETEYEVFQKDANELVKELNNIDIMYIDPPYNQHPYGSNYFMLNLIVNNKLESKVSKVSGIPDDWNRSVYNKRKEVKEAIDNLVRETNSKYLIISYNSEGFITLDEMQEVLSKYGTLKIKEIQYNAYKASRNLKNRDKYVKEFLFILKKEI